MAYKSNTVRTSAKGVNQHKEVAARLSKRLKLYKALSTAQPAREVYMCSVITTLDEQPSGSTWAYHSAGRGLRVIAIAILAVTGCKA